MLVLQRFASVVVLHARQALGERCSAQHRGDPIWLGMYRTVVGWDRDIEVQSSALFLQVSLLLREKLVA